MKGGEEHWREKGKREGGGEEDTELYMGRKMQNASFVDDAIDEPTDKLIKL